MKRALTVVLFAVLITLAALGTASAHATLNKCTPGIGAKVAAAPAQVTCTTSEEIDTKLSTISVWDASGAQVDKKDGKVDLNDADHKTLVVSLDPTKIKDGAYTVKYHVVTPDDGGVTDGTFQFIVGASNATPAPTTQTLTDMQPAGTASPTAAATKAATAAPTTAATSAATTSPTTAPTTAFTVAPTTTAAAPTATRAAPSTLPSTGSAGSGLSLVGIALVLAVGLAAAGLSARRFAR